MNTTYSLNKAAEKVWGTSPLWLALSTTIPNVDGTGISEPIVPGNGYNRVEITELSNPKNGEIVNTQKIVFPIITKPSGVATCWVIFDSPTVGGGNPIAYDEFDESIQLRSRTQVLIDANGIVLAARNAIA